MNYFLFAADVNDVAAVAYLVFSILFVTESVTIDSIFRQSRGHRTI